MPEFVPAVGRIVHYKSFGTSNGEYKSECRAAIITAVHSDTLDLCVLNLEGMFFTRSVHASGVTVGEISGTWHEPERV
jgi:hypothetical protein